MSEKLLYSYSMPRPFKGLNIPLPLQTIFMRDYANAERLKFVLPRVEWCMKDIYFVLESMILSDKINDIAMTSIFILPSEKSYRLKSLFEIKRNLTLHFPLEGLKVPADEIIEVLENYEELNNISRLPEETLYRKFEMIQ